MELPASFFVPSNQCVTPNALGYTEFAFMSTSQDKSVAVQYSGVRGNKPKASIMEIHPNSVDRGADISEFSQYPGEKEFLIVPYSFVQGEGRLRIEITEGGGVLTVISVRVSINLKTETVEQMRRKKRSIHLAALKSLIDETEHWMQMYVEAHPDLVQASAARDNHAPADFFCFEDPDIFDYISHTMEQMRRIQNSHCDIPDDDYVNDLKYNALVTQMLSTQAWAKQKLISYLGNAQLSVHDLYLKSLRTAHRMWLSFLKRQHSATSVGSEERKKAAVKILQCMELMVTNDASTEQSEGEPLIYTAAADGWAAEDLQLVVDAGASLAAVNKSGNCALIAASENGDIRTLEALVLAGADVNQLCKDTSGKNTKEGGSDSSSGIFRA
jgi:hypothetical protein